MKWTFCLPLVKPNFETEGGRVISQVGLLKESPPPVCIHLLLVYEKATLNDMESARSDSSIDAL